MTEDVATHYGAGGALAEKIAVSLRRSGKDLGVLTTADLATVDEFHIRGRTATLELAAQMKLSESARVLDIGSGLGGPARTLAEVYGCHVTGIDLTQAFCDVAIVLSDWVGLSNKVAFRQGDATDLPFADDQFDAAMTIHVAMNIPAKDKVYGEARRVLKPGGILAIYDVLQGEGGVVVFPVPWAMDPTISHLATAEDMNGLLTGAGFKILDVQDSTGESQSWFEAMTMGTAQSGPPPVTSRILFEGDYREMFHNQVRNLAERRIRTVSYICEA